MTEDADTLIDLIELSEESLGVVKAALKEGDWHRVVTYLKEAIYTLEDGLEGAEKALKFLEYKERQNEVEG